MGRDLLMRQLDYCRELDWANVFHDSIKGKPWLNELPINHGRWAGTYPFFYILNRILGDMEPKAILELGLGESSKFISTYLQNSLHNSTHTIVEHDESWSDTFKQRFCLSSRSDIKIHPLKTLKMGKHETLAYQGMEIYSSGKYDLYVIDGPFGSPHHSRHNIVELVKSRKVDDEFIIVLDDVQRIGELETLDTLLKILEDDKGKVYSQIYRGMYQTAVIATERYRFACSL